jgi:hypothetical protein
MAISSAQGNGVTRTRHALTMKTGKWTKPGLEHAKQLRIVHNQRFRVWRAADLLFAALDRTRGA